MCIRDRLIAFKDYNVIKGVLGSPWVGLEYFKRFLSSPDFMNYLMNTLKVSIYGLLWGFPVPIILCLLYTSAIEKKCGKRPSMRGVSILISLAIIIAIIVVLIMMVVDVYKRQYLQKRQNPPAKLHETVL